MADTKTYTTNYNLEKPGQDDFYNVDDFNRNADKIDTELKVAADRDSTHKTAAVLDHPDNSVTDAKIGNRTITDTVTAAAGANTVTNLFSMIGNMLKRITGKTAWYTAPATTLEAANTHITATTSIHGATNANTANTIVQRDASGNFIANTITAALNGLAATATKLATARTINNVAFDGSANITIADTTKAPIAHSSTATTYGVSTASAYGHTMASSATPLVNGTAAVGTDNGKFAREGHVHPTDTTRAPLASPVLTGVPVAPTAAVGTDSDQIATMAAVKNAVSGLTGTRVWVSDEYTPIQNTPTVVSHGITGLDPLYAKCDILLKCVEAEQGYSVGDYACGWTSVSSGNTRGANPSLSFTSVLFSTPGTIVILHKTTPGSSSSITMSKWRYIFRIWY